ncbi:MAG: universal stress protein [Nitrospirota bacterium]|nr:universal stress protein [Nitrospirota bacterium]
MKKHNGFHLLLAVDGSEGAMNAVRTVATLPLPDGARITLLHVLTRYLPTHTALPGGVLGQLRADEDARAQAVLKQAADLLRAIPVKLAQRVADGHPAQQILERAASSGVDLIVLGALGTSGWLRTLLGSTSQSVVKHAPCPVWLVRKPYAGGAITVLAGSDGSPGARAAMRFLRAMPLPDPRTAHLLHVLPSLNQQLQLTGGPLDPPVLEPLYEIGAHLERRAAELLRQDTALLSAAFPTIVPHTEEGDARRVILEKARTLGADLIVLGSRGLSGWKELLLGSVCNKVTRHSETSVLVVPDAGRDDGK